MASKNSLEDVKKEIRSLLMSAGSSMSLSLNNLIKDYESLMNKDFPHKRFGFSTPTDFLRSMPDVARWDLRGLIVAVPNKETAGMGKLITNQMRKKGGRIGAGGGIDVIKPGTRRHNSARMKTFAPKYRPSPSYPTRQPAPAPREQLSYSNACSGSSTSNAGWTEENYENKIQNLLSSFPDGILMTDFLAKFKSVYGISLSSYHHGHSCVQDLLYSLKSIVSVRESSEGYRLYPTIKQLMEIDPLMPTCKLSIEEKLSCNVQSLLALHPEGILLKDFSRRYQQEKGMAFDVHQCGYSSVLEYFNDLIDIVTLVATGEADFLIFDSRLRPARPDDSKRKTSQEPQKAAPRSVLSLGLPADIAPLDSSYQSMALPSNFFNNFYAIFVSNIDSPTQFWVQLKGKWTSSCLEDLMDSLDAFYNGKYSGEYKIPQKLIKEGLCCIGIYPDDKNWHRVVIRKVFNDSVELFYVDYGSTATVSIDSLRFALPRFLKLQAQGLRATMINIEPVLSGWTHESVDAMLELVCNTEVTALMVGMGEGILQLALIRITESGKEVHVNDHLVDQGFARFISQPQPAGQEKGAESQMKSRCFLFVEVDDKCSFELIRVQDQLHLTSAQISSFIWPEDCLRQMIRRRCLEVPSLVLRQSEHLDLFVAMKNQGIPGACVKGVLRENIIMYPLPSVIIIVKTFLPEQKLLLKTLEAQKQQFNVNDPYWRGCDWDANSEDGSSQGDPAEISPIQVQQALEILKLKERRIKRDLEEKPGDSGLLQKLENIKYNIKCFAEDLSSEHESSSQEKPAATASSSAAMSSDMDKLITKMMDHSQAALKLTQLQLDMLTRQYKEVMLGLSQRSEEIERIVISVMLSQKARQELVRDACSPEQAKMLAQQYFMMISNCDDTMLFEKTYDQHVAANQYLSQFI